MANYKLKHTYPGSPDLGYIIKPKSPPDPSCYWSGQWFEPELYPEFWEKVVEKSALFTTEDGKEIFYGDKVYFSDSQWKVCEFKIYAITDIAIIGKCQIFSNSELCNKFIEENKPQYSKKDMIEFADTCRHSYYSVMPTKNMFNIYIKK